MFKTRKIHNGGEKLDFFRFMLLADRAYAKLNVVHNTCTASNLVAIHYLLLTSHVFVSGYVMLYMCGITTAVKYLPTVDTLYLTQYRFVTTLLWKET